MSDYDTFEQEFDEGDATDETPEIDERVVDATEGVGEQTTQLGAPIKDLVTGAQRDKQSTIDTWGDA